MPFVISGDGSAQEKFEPILNLVSPLITPIKALPEDASTDMQGHAVGISNDGRFILIEDYIQDTDSGPLKVLLYDAQTHSSSVVAELYWSQSTGSPGAIMSGDGRYVAYGTYDHSAFGSDGNSLQDIFVFDSQTQTTRMVTGGPNGHSVLNAISDDGHYLTFTSDATTLVRNDSNDLGDAFLYNTQTGEITLVSVTPDGHSATGYSIPLGISADGHHVLFASSAHDLVSGTPGNLAGLFLYDTQSHAVSPIPGPQCASVVSQISADGRYVAYTSNKYDPQRGWSQDVYLFDAVAGTTNLVSANAEGKVGNGTSIVGPMSPDGRFLTYYSSSSTLAPNDNNDAYDVFLYDALTHQTKLISATPEGASGRADFAWLSYRQSVPVAISDDGRFVTFQSYDTDLVYGDNNHWYDAFLYDNEKGTVTLIGRASSGPSVSTPSYTTTRAMSADGRFIALDSNGYLGNDHTLWQTAGLLYDRLGTSSSTYYQNDAPVTLAGLATVTDPVLSAANDFRGANLTVTRATGADSSDVFSASGALDGLAEGSTLSVSGHVIGAVVRNSAGTLELLFAVGATQALVNAAIQSIAYANSSSAPPPSVEMLWTFSSGADGRIASATSRVSMGDVPKLDGAVETSVVKDSGIVTIDLLQGASDTAHHSLHIERVNGLWPGMIISGTSLLVDTSVLAPPRGDASFSYVVSDGDTAVYQTATITLIDPAAPHVAGPVTCVATEATGNAIFDLLAGASTNTNRVLHVAGVSGLASALKLDGDSIIVDTAAFGTLHAGETRSFQLTYLITDNSLSTAQTATITINGVNDAPKTAGPVTASVMEDAGAASFDLLATATDIDSQLLHITHATGLVPGLSLSGDALLIDTAAFQSLCAGALRSIEVHYDVTDGSASAPTSATITIRGQNDAASISGVSTGKVVDSERGRTKVSGKLQVIDPDAGESDWRQPTAEACHGRYGDFTFKKGNWTYALDQAKADALAAGEIFHEELAVTSLDGTATSVLDITVQGTNDRPEARSDQKFSVAPDGRFDISAAALLAAVTDQDGDTLTIVSVGRAKHGSVLLAGGVVTFKPDAGYTGQAGFNYVVSDGHGGNATVPVRVMVTGKTVVASDAGELLNGSSGADRISAGAGSDTILGGGGDDVIVSSAGEGKDVYDGGSGRDTLDVSHTQSPVRIVLGTPSPFARLADGASHSLISIENVIGTGLDDFITGDNGANKLSGGGGNDHLIGGGGNDTLTGGSGNDVLIGGAGADTFVFKPGCGNDTILKFNSGRAADHDTLDLRGLDFRNVADILAHTAEGPSAVILAGSAKITLANISKAQLAAHPFDMLV